MSLCPAFRHRLRSLWHQFFGTIALMEFVLKNRANSYALLVSLPANEAMHVPWHRVWKLWQVLAHSFSEQSYWWNYLSWKTRANSCAFLVSLPANEAMHVPTPNVANPSYCPRFPIRPRCPRFPLAPSHRTSPQAISYVFPSVHHVHPFISLPPNGPLPKLFPTFSHPSTMSTLPSRSQAIFPTFSRPSTMSTLPSVLLPPNGALPKLFPTVSHPSTVSTLPSRSLRTELSPSYDIFPRFPIRCPHFHLTPSNEAPSKLFPTVSRPSTLSLLPSRSLPTYFARFSIHPRWPRFRLAPSQRSSPYICRCFPSVRPVVASISLPPSSPRATLSHPSTVSTLSPRPLPTDLSPSYFPPFPVRPPCLRFYLAPSQRSSPQAISHGFPSVHPVVASISLPPNGALPKLFPTVSRPSTLSSLPSRSTKLFPTVPSVHLVVASVSLPPRESKLNEHRRCFEEEYNMS